MHLRGRPVGGRWHGNPNLYCQSLRPSHSAPAPSDKRKKKRATSQEKDPQVRQRQPVTTFQMNRGTMRFCEGDHAYEVERVLDPATQIYSGWRFNVYRVRPGQQLLRSGEAATQEEAEKAGKKALAEVIKAEQKE